MHVSCRDRLIGGECVDPRTVVLAHLNGSFIGIEALSVKSFHIHREFTTLHVRVSLEGKEFCRLRLWLRRWLRLG